MCCNTEMVNNVLRECYEEISRKSAINLEESDKRFANKLTCAWALLSELFHLSKLFSAVCTVRLF